MVNQEIKGTDYVVHYSTNTVTFQGELALGGPQEYAPINDLLTRVANSNLAVITLDFRQLSFLNSSGISMLCKFVLNLRKKEGVQLAILGSHDIPWQGKSLRNLQKFLPSLSLDLE
ncbi:MAG: STAS domain-containing protein [Symploca sp. SIO2G7]|nr:STAS domain-containing protein [Symploca sp. SIO2G7]